MEITIARVYESTPKKSGEYRILVDRLWPRGLRKEEVRYDMWAKQIAPSPELRKWFNHEPQRFSEFSKRYIEELENNENMDEFIKSLKKQQHIVLLYGAKDPKINHAVILRQHIQKLM